jgi:hypothetical protein
MRRTSPRWNTTLPVRLPPQLREGSVLADLAHELDRGEAGAFLDPALPFLATVYFAGLTVIPGRGAAAGLPLMALGLLALGRGLAGSRAKHAAGSPGGAHRTTG